MRYCHCSVQCPQSVNLSDCAALTHFASVIGCIYWTSSCHALFSSSKGETWIWRWRLCGFHASPGFAKRKTDVRPRGPWPHCLLLKVAVVDVVFPRHEKSNRHSIFIVYWGSACSQTCSPSFLSGRQRAFAFLHKGAWIWFFKLIMPMWSTDPSTQGSVSGKPTVLPWVCVQVCFTSLHSQAEHLNAPPSGSAAFCHRVVDKCPRCFRVIGKKTYLWVHLLAEHCMANTSNNNPEPEKPAVRGHLWKPRQSTLAAHACPISPDMQGLWHASTIEI